MRVQVRSGKARKGATCLVVVALAAIGSSMLATGALAKPSPKVAWTSSRNAMAGAPISVSWSSSGLGPSKLAIQHQVGTAHVWRTIIKLSSPSGSAQLPARGVGKYRYRLSAIHGRHVVARQVVTIRVFGEVPLSKLFNREEHVVTTSQFTFSYAFASQGQYATGETSTDFSIEHSYCTSVHIGFVGELLGEDNMGYPGGNATVTLVQASREPVSATVPYLAMGSVDATLTLGQSWAVNTSDSQGPGNYTHQAVTYFNGYAICDSTSLKEETQ